LILEWQQLTLVENSAKLLHFLHDSVAWINFWADLRSTLTATWQQKSANSQDIFVEFSPGKTQATNKKTRKNTSVMSFKSGISWPTMANHGQFEWVGGGYLTAADCSDNDPVAFQLHGSQDGV